MADEYIKREDVLSLKKPFPNQKGMITLYRQYFINPEAVEQLPAADVAPVVRGRWIDKNAGNATCSVCKRRHKDVCDDDNSDSFCRSCGAKMEVQDG